MRWREKVADFLPNEGHTFTQNFHVCSYTTRKLRGQARGEERKRVPLSLPAF